MLRVLAAKEDDYENLKKSAEKKADVKKVKEPKNEEIIEIPDFDIGLEQFNDELNKAIKKIDKK